jgi:hypothetical protein
MTKVHLLVPALIVVLSAIGAVKEAGAQPSGGPYGPLRRSYALPSEKGRIFYVAPGGNASASGETLGEPTTIEAAIARVRTGDAIVMRGGTYRTGNLLLNQGITIQPYGDEQPELKGTAVAAAWENLGNGLWTTRWMHLFPSKPADWWQRKREGKKTPLYRFNNDMVFVDGKLLHAVGWEGEVDKNSYYIDYESGLVYVGIDPARRLVEITAFDVAILRTTAEIHGVKSDRKGYTLRGLAFTGYAYRALEIEGKDPEGLTAETLHGKDVVGSTLEDCSITFCSRVAGYFRGDHLTIRHCRVSDTRTEGVYILGSSDVLLEGNIFTRNNIEAITGYYPAAVKIFNQCCRVTCRDNLVTDLPNSNGIWYDVGNVDGVFVDNWIEGVGRLDRPVDTAQVWPSDNGFFFEISKGAVCAGNLFVNCDHGLLVLNSSSVRIERNTFVNSMACIARNGRVAAGDHFGWHASTGPSIDARDGHLFIDNLLTGGREFDRPLLYVWEPDSLCRRFPAPMLKLCDNNVAVRMSPGGGSPLILWSPAIGERCQSRFDSLEDLRGFGPSFSAHSRTFIGYGGPLFKSAELGDFRVLAAFPGSEAGSSLPQDVAGIPGPAAQGGSYVGAYPPLH